MALNPEDKKDVQNHMGKALANKVEKATRDKGRKLDVVSKSKPIYFGKTSKRGRVDIKGRHGFIPSGHESAMKKGTTRKYLSGDY